MRNESWIFNLVYASYMFTIWHHNDSTTVILEAIVWLCKEKKIQINDAWYDNDFEGTIRDT